MFPNLLIWGTMTYIRMVMKTADTAWKKAPKRAARPATPTMRVERGLKIAMNESKAVRAEPTRVVKCKTSLVVETPRTMERRSST